MAHSTAQAKVSTAQHPTDHSEDHSDFEIERVWAEEAERRVDQLRRGEVEAIPGDEALRRVRAKLG